MKNYVKYLIAIAGGASVGVLCYYLSQSRKETIGKGLDDIFTNYADAYDALPSDVLDMIFEDWDRWSDGPYQFISWTELSGLLRVYNPKTKTYMAFKVDREAETIKLFCYCNH